MENSYIEGDRLMRSCPVYPYDNIRKLETVITKEEFLMCYKAWVENEMMYGFSSHIFTVDNKNQFDEEIRCILLRM